MVKSRGFGLRTRGSQSPETARSLLARALCGNLSILLFVLRTLLRCPRVCTACVHKNKSRGTYARGRRKISFFLHYYLFYGTIPRSRLPRSKKFHEPFFVNCFCIRKKIPNPKPQSSAEIIFTTASVKQIKAIATSSFLHLVSWAKFLHAVRSRKPSIDNCPVENSPSRSDPRMLAWIFHFMMTN